MLGCGIWKGSKVQEMKKRVLSKIEGRVRKVEMLRATFGLGTKEALSVRQLDIRFGAGLGHRWMDAMGRFWKG